MVSTVDTCVSAQIMRVQRHIVRYYTENAGVALWRIIVVVRVECRGCKPWRIAPSHVVAVDHDDVGSFEYGRERDDGDNKEGEHQAIVVVAASHRGKMGALCGLL